MADFGGSHSPREFGKASMQYMQTGPLQKAQYWSLSGQLNVEFARTRRNANAAFIVYNRQLILKRFFKGSYKNLVFGFEKCELKL